MHIQTRCGCVRVKKKNYYCRSGGGVHPDFDSSSVLLLIPHPCAVGASACQFEWRRGFQPPLFVVNGVTSKPAYGRELQLRYLFTGEQASQGAWSWGGCACALSFGRLWQSLRQGVVRKKEPDLLCVVRFVCLSCETDSNESETPSSAITGAKDRSILPACLCCV